MEFYIHSDRYFLREDENRAFTLMSHATNQTLEFDGSLHPLIYATDRWIDLSSYTRMLQIMSFDRKKTARLLEDALFALHAAGLADLKDIPSFGGTGIRWASLRDAHAVSGFCRANLEKSRSCTVSLDSRYYSCPAIYTRIKQGAEYFLLKEEEGQIRAVALFGLSYRYFGNSAFELRSFIFEDGMDDETCRKTICDLASYARQSLKGKVLKLRYEFINPRQQFIVDALKESGFREKAHFRSELKSGGDLILLDLV